MSRHEGVSCDSCMKGNFRGRRFKCLVCYDYDLCSSCYEAGVSTTRHATSHPMQCILTRSDNDLYFGGEAALATEHQNSFTCPFCSKMGFTESTLQEHVASLHGDASQEVVCPICASFPGGDPNHLTEDFQGHLNLEHRAGAGGGGGGARDLISFLDEPGGGGVHRQGAVRRIAHSRGGLTSHRTRRHNAAPSSGPLGPSTLSSLSPATREAVDPIAELLSQLSGVRRAAGGTSSSQLHQLQMELQLQRQQAHRQTLDRLTRRPAGGSSGAAAGMAAPTQQHPAGSGLAALPGQSGQAAAGLGAGTSNTSSQQQSKDSAKNGAGFLLATLEAEESSDEEEGDDLAEETFIGEEEEEGANSMRRRRRERGTDTAKQKQIFIQELLLSALSLGNSLEEQEKEAVDQS